MKLATIFAAVVSFTSVSAASFAWSSNPEQNLLVDDTDLNVPGENPLQFCQDPTENLLVIEEVDLDPNPPKAGANLSISATGKLLQDIEEGAKIHLQVKFGLITLINQETDLCDQVKNVELECPLKKGDLALTKEVSLPSQIPPGKYTVLADVFTKDGEKITCLTATVWFHRG